MRKGLGREAKLSYQGHVLMENRHGLAVDGCVTQATGHLPVASQVPPSSRRLSEIPLRARGDGIRRLPILGKTTVCHVLSLQSLQ
jgi:hypothetical protein